MKVGSVMVSSLGGKQHRAVCVGVDSNGFVALVLATSKVAKVKGLASRRQNLRIAESVVEVKQEEYQSGLHPNICSLTKHTCFDCNEIITHHVDLLLENNPL